MIIKHPTLRRHWSELDQRVVGAWLPVSGRRRWLLAWRPRTGRARSAAVVWDREPARLAAGQMAGVRRRAGLIPLVRWLRGTPGPMIWRLRGRLDACWRDYFEVRRNSDDDATGRARDLCKAVFFAWVAVFVACEAARDEQVIAEARERREQAMRLHPVDAFPRQRSRSGEIVYQSGERAP
jgi:hypothetical protein